METKSPVQNTVISADDLYVLGECDRAFDEKNPSFLVGLLEAGAGLGIKIRAVTMLAEIGDADCVPVLSRVIREDPNPLVRHEGAFTLGQLGYPSALPALIDAMLNDDHVMVRHESAAALGSIGDQRARDALTRATRDVDEFVGQSAIVALLNLDYLESKRRDTSKES